MTWQRALATIGLVSAALTAALAVASRAPADLRIAQPTSEDFDPALGASFTELQRARSAAYRVPAYVFFIATFALQAIALVVLARGPIGRVVAAFGSWWIEVAVAAAVIAAVLFAAQLPLSFVRGFVMEHAWGLSTQDAAGWMVDKAKTLGLSAVMSVGAALVFVGVVRLQPRLWWLWGWIGFSILTVLLTYLWPILIAPLFNRFEPLRDEALASRIQAVAAGAGVEVDRILVADASRRTHSANAYVAGLSNTKRVVLYDTLLEADTDEIVFVVAHELGHAKENHVAKGVVLSSVTILVGFVTLFMLARVRGLWEWSGAPGPGDARALPLVALAVLVGTLLITPLQSAVSRSFERRADRVAFELVPDPSGPVGMFRRLGLINMADLDPPSWAEWALFSHPPIPERIERALEYRASSP